MEKEKILVADDTQTVRLLSQRALNAAGFEVLLAVDGSEAVALAAEHQPPVVVLDIQMPVMNGYEACDQILKLPGCQNRTKIIFLTCEQGCQLDQLGKQYGAYLRKPLKSELLVETVGKLLKEVSASKQSEVQVSADVCNAGLALELCRR